MLHWTALMVGLTSLTKIPCHFLLVQDRYLHNLVSSFIRHCCEAGRRLTPGIAEVNFNGLLIEVVSSHGCWPPTASPDKLEVKS